jgi:hypothetical protein
MGLGISSSSGSLGRRLYPKTFAKKLSVEKLFSKNIPITTENLAINFDDFGRPSLTLIGDYFKASKEVADLVGKLAVSDTAKALELEDAFSSIKSYDDSYLFKAADFLEVRYKAITPLQGVLENKWQEAEGEAKLILADQLRNYFTICKARGDAKTFSQFADEVKRIYKGLARDAIEIASQSLGEEGKDFLRLANQGEKKSRNKKLILGLSALGLIAASLGAWYFSQDRQPPEVKKTEYKPRVNKGEKQDFSAFVNEKNPAQTASLKLNGTSIDVPLFQDFKNGSLLYKTSFDPASISTREGKLIGEFVVKDKSGNEAKSSVNFLANLEEPQIKDLKIEKIQPGKYYVSALIEEQNLKEAYLQLLNRTKIPLVRTDSKYSANISTKTDLDFYVKAEDAFNLSSLLKGSIRITDRDKFENWLPSEFDKALALSLFDASPLVQELFKKNELSALTSLLKVAQLNGSSIPKNLAYSVSDQIWRDSRVKDKSQNAEKAFDLLLSLGIRDLKNFGSVHIPGNYSQALIQGLPEHSEADLKRVFEASELCADIVDFEPVIVKDVTGNRIVIQSQNLSRDYWMVVNLLKERPVLASQAKKFEWLNRMIQQVAWDIFDYEYGPKYFDKKSYKPNDTEVWQVILSFHDYIDALPAKLEKDGIEVIIPYHDSDLLRSSIPDKTNRTIALFYLADLPAKTVNKTYAAELRRLVQERKITSAEYDRLYQEKAVVRGIEGMKLFVEQLPMEYEEIVRLYPNGKVGIWNEDPRSYYYGWLGDRQGHGLNNTVYQYVGIKLGEATTWPEFIRLIQERNGIDQFLTKNWKHWDLVKFIYGYERFAFPGGEWEMYAYGLPLAYKAFGIPYGGIAINPDTYLINQGSPRGEWGVILPNNVVKQLKQEFPNQNIIIGHGNVISLFSCLDGLLKDSDGVEYLESGIRIPVYLWKK